MDATPRLACPLSYSGQVPVVVSGFVSGFAHSLSGLSVDRVRVHVRRYPGHHIPHHGCVCPGSEPDR
jgi:hypothetical protein